MILRKSIIALAIWDRVIDGGEPSQAVTIHQFQDFKDEPCLLPILGTMPDCVRPKGDIGLKNSKLRTVQLQTLGDVVTAAAEPGFEWGDPVFEIASEPPCIARLINSAAQTDILYPVVSIQNYPTESIITTKTAPLEYVRLEIDMNFVDFPSELAGAFPSVVDSEWVFANPLSNATLVETRFVHVTDVIEGGLVKHLVYISNSLDTTDLNLTPVYTSVTITPPFFLSQGDIAVQYDDYVSAVVQSNPCEDVPGSGSCCDEEIWSTIAPTLLGKNDDLGTKIAAAFTVDKIRSLSGKTGKNASITNVLGQSLLQALISSADLEKTRQNSKNSDAAIDL